MPAPNPASPTDADIMDFSDAPGGDVALDELFGTSEPAATAQPTTATTNTDQPTAPTTSQPAATDSMFLDAGSSKYKTREEAIRGLTHKDEVIEHLRSIAVQSTGIDPLTGQKVAVPHPQSSGVASAPRQDDSYLNNPAKYSADLRDAVARNDEARYMQVQQKLASEQMMAQFAPVAPLLQQFAVRSAVDSVAQVNPEFTKFYGTPEYKNALDARPILKAAVQNAEQNFEYQSQLPELYRLVYEVSQLQKMSELVKSQQSTSNPSVRPTTTPSTLAPPAQGSTNGNWRTNPDAAKALVEEFERKNGM